MRNFSIGNLTVKMMEGPDDINDGRYQELMNYMYQIYEYVDKPDAGTFIGEYYKAVDVSSVSKRDIAVYNYRYALSNFNPDKPSAWAFMFALITLEEGEDQSKKETRDQNYLAAKVERYRDAGLMAGTVKKEVENFFLQCPELLNVYSRMQEIILNLRSYGNSEGSTSGQPEPKQ